MTQLLLNGRGDFDELLVVQFGNGKQHDEEGHQQGDGVRIGHQPVVSPPGVG